MPATLDDLAGHARIGYDKETAFIRGMKGQVPWMRRDPDLIRLFADDVAPVLDTWLAMHEDLRDSPRCRVVFDALAAGLLRYVSGD